jgi:hypothetical protein
LQTRPLPSEPTASRSGIVFLFEGEALTEAWLTSTKIEEQATGEQIQQMLQELQVQSVRTASVAIALPLSAALAEEIQDG